MALIYNDGFDHYGDNASLHLRKWGAGFTLGTPARTGTTALVSANSAFFALEQPYTSGVLGFAFYAANFSGFQALTFWTAASAPVFSIEVEDDGSITIRSGQYNGSVLAQSLTGIVQPGSYLYLEIGFFNLGASTTLEVRANGAFTPVVSTTASFAATPITQVCTITDSTAFRMDDYYELDTTGSAPNNSYLGDSACVTRIENANGPNQDWTVNGGGAAYAALGHIPTVPGTNYLSSSTAGDTSDFTVPDLPPETGSVSGIQIFVQANKSDAGSCSIDVGLNSDGTVGNIPTITPGTANMMYVGQLEQDPDTSDFWTVAAANAILPTTVRAS